MSQTPDDRRIVEMQFDNRQFEAATAESMATLDKLKDKLEFSDSYKGLDKISEAVKKVDITPLTSSVENVGSRFDWLASLADGFFFTIGQNIERIAEKIGGLIKSFTLDPILSGFSSYERELKSIQTIMATTGSSMDYVTEQMKKLAWYTDETSYSYEGMVENISKFTSQGIKLDTATSAMQGIANMAGYAGASVTDATHSMEGFAKALAAQKMTKQNWSWIQTAHMETVQTKQAFIDAAVEAGNLRKVSDGVWEETFGKNEQVTIANFAETLKDGWLNAKAMMQAFSDMSSYSDVLYEFINAYKDVTGETINCSEAMELLGDTSVQNEDKTEAYARAMRNLGNSTYTAEQAQKDLANWTKTASEIGFEQAQIYKTFGDAVEATKTAVVTNWKQIFSSLLGNAEQAKELWTAVGESMYDIFVTDLSEVKDAIVEWSGSGGFEKIFTIITGSLSELQRLMEPFHDLLTNLFPPITVQSLDTFVTKIIEFGQRMKLSEEALQGFRIILGYLEPPLQIMKQLLELLGTAIEFVIVKVKDVTESFLEFFNRFPTFTSLLDALKDSFSQWGSIVKEKFLGVFQGFQPTLTKASDGLKKFFSAILNSKVTTTTVGVLAVSVGGLVEVIRYGLVQAFEAIQKIDFTKITGYFKNFGASVSDLFDRLKLGEKINSSIEKITGYISKLGEAISEFAERIKVKEKLETALSAIGGAFVSFGSTVKNFVESLELDSKFKMVFDGIVGTIKKFADDIIGIFQSGSLTEAFSKGVKAITDLVQGLITSISSLFTVNIDVKGGVVGAVNTVLDLGKKLGGGVLKAGGDALWAFREIVENTFGMTAYAATMNGNDTIVDKGEKIIGIAEKLKGISLPNLEGLKDMFVKLWTSVKTFLDGLDWGQLVVTAFAAILGKTVLDLSNVAVKIGTSVTGFIDAFAGIGKAATKLIESFTGIGTSITDVFKAIKTAIGTFSVDLTNTMKSVQKWINAKAMEETSKTWLRFAAAISAVAASLTALYLVVDDVDKFKQLAIIFGVEATWMTGLMSAVALLEKFAQVDFTKFSVAFAGFAASMLILAGGIAVLGGIDPAVVTNATNTVFSMMTLFTLFSALMTFSKTMSTGLSAFGSTMTKLAVTIDLLVAPLLALGAIGALAPGVIVIGEAAIAGLFGIFAAFEYLMTSVKGISKSAKEFTKNMLLFVAAIDALTPAVIALGILADKTTWYSLPLAEAAIAGMEGLFYLFAKMIENIQITPAKIDKFTNVLMKFSVAVDLMAVAIKLLGSIPLDQLAQGSLVCTGLLTVFTTLAGVVSAFNKDLAKNLDSFGTAMERFAITIALMIIPIKLLGTMPLPEIEQGAIACAKLLTLFTAFAVILELFNKNDLPKNIAKFGLAMVEFATALNLMLIPIFILGNIDDTGVLVKGEAAVSALIIVFGLVGKLLANNKEISKNIDKFGTAMIKLTGAVAICSGLIILLQGIDAAQALVTSVALTSVMVALGYCFSTINKECDPDKINKALKSFVLLELASGAIAGIFYLLNGIDWKSTLAVAGGMSTTIIAIATALKILSSNEKDLTKAALAADIISVGLLAVAGGIKIANGVDWTTALATGAVMSSVVLAIAGALKIFGDGSLQTIIAAGAIDIVMGGLVALCYGLSLLKDVEWETILAATVALNASILVISGMLALLSAAGPMAIAAAAAIDVACAGFVILAKAFQMFSEIDSNGLQNALNVLIDAGQHVGDLALFALSLTALSVAGLALGAALVVLAAGIAALGGGIAVLSSTSAAFEAFLVVLGQLGSTLTSVGEGLVSFATSTIETLSVLAVGIPTSLGLVARSISEQGPVLGKAAGDLILGFVTGLTQSVAENTPKIISAAGDIVNSLIEGFENNTVIGRLIGAGKNAVQGFLDGVLQKISGGNNEVAQAGTQLGNEFSGSAMEALDEHSPSKILEWIGQMAVEGFTGGITDKISDAVASGSDLGTALTDGLGSGLEGLQNVGSKVLGLFQNGLSDIDLGSLGAKLGSVFSTSFTVESSKKISGYIAGMKEALASTFRKPPEWAAYSLSHELTATEEETKKETDLLGDLEKQLGSVADQATSTGGASSGAAKQTTKSLQDLYKEYSFGQGAVDAFVKKYGDAIKKIDETADVTNVAEVAIAKLAGTLYESSGKTIDTSKAAIEQQEEMLKGLKETYDAVYGSIQNTINGVDLFAEHQAEEIGPAGESMRTYIWNAQENLKTVKTYINDFKSLAEKDIDPGIIKYMADLGLSGLSMVQAFKKADEDDLKRIQALWQEKQQISETGADEIFATFAAAGMDLDQLTVEELRKITGDINAGYSNGIDQKAGVTPATNMALNMLKALRDTLGIASPSKKTYEIGQFAAIGMKNGIDDDAGQVKTSMVNMAVQALSALTAKIHDYESIVNARGKAIGTNICLGIRNGIVEGRSMVINAAAEMVAAAIAAAEAKADINSPSKVFKWMGEMMDEGLAIGIRNNKGLVAEAGSDLMSSTFDELAAFLSQSMDLDPVIHPVLDMSTVARQVSQLNSMFDSNQALAASVKYGGIQNGMREARASGAISFVQNNYSPKALSRTEIYRQTKNQFAMMKEVVNGI